MQLTLFATHIVLMLSIQHNVQVCVLYVFTGTLSHVLMGAEERKGLLHTSISTYIPVVLYACGIYYLLTHKHTRCTTLHLHSHTCTHTQGHKTHVQLVWITIYTVLLVYSFPPPFITGENSNEWLLNAYQSDFSHWLPSATADTIKK